MKSLFIDSNILLNFYDFHDEDLEQLNKLADLIDTGEIKLYLTTQVLHEVKKHRDTRLSDSYSKFTSYKFSAPMPVFCKSYELYSDIKRAQVLLDKLKSQLSKQISTDIQSRQLKADIVLELLTDKCELINSDRYLDLAIKRHQLGRPPGKKDRSHGDEINWEGLLAEVSNDGDFIIVSQDGDYSSSVNKHELKDYLSDEWTETKTSNIYFYRSLSSFFAEHDIKIELQIEEEKSLLVEDLINSPNFLTTHGLIAKLSKYVSFSDEQLKGLATALLENSQVGWISRDNDVLTFYRSSFVDKSEKFEPELWSRIRAYLWPDSEESDTKNELDELISKEKEIYDIPF